MENEIRIINEQEFEKNFDKEFDALLEAAKKKQISFDMTPNEEVPAEFKDLVLRVINQVETTYINARGKLENNKVELGKSGRALTRLTDKNKMWQSLGQMVSLDIVHMILGRTTLGAVAAGMSLGELIVLLIRCAAAIIKSCTNIRKRIANSPVKNRYDLVFRYPVSLGNGELISNLNKQIAENIKKLGFKEQLLSIGRNGRALTMKGKNDKIYACVYGYKGSVDDDYIHCLCLEDTQRNRDKLGNKIAVYEAADMFANLELI